MLKISGVMWSNFEIKIICIASGTMQTQPEDIKKISFNLAKWLFLRILGNSELPFKFIGFKSDRLGIL